MDFALSEEQQAFRDVIRRWVDAEAPKDWMRKLEADEENYPFAFWDKLAANGFFGIGIDEEYGGQGGDITCPHYQVFLNGTSRREEPAKRFFFEKKNQKTFVS